MYLTFYAVILSVCLLREAEAQQWLNFLEAVGKEISGLKAGGKEAGGKKAGSKEVSRFLVDFVIALL